MMKNTLSTIPKRIFLWGGSGQAIVVREIVEYYNSRIVAVFDDNPNSISPFNDIPLLHGESDFDDWIEGQTVDDLGFCITIGNRGGFIRLKIHRRLTARCIQPTNMVHPTAWVSASSEIGDGVQVLSGAIIAPACKIGMETIVNTNASVDHNSQIGEGVEIAPGATLCGYVQIGNGTLIGAGATVLPKVVIGENSIIGAGALVNRHVADNVTVMGMPARNVDLKNRPKKLQ